MNETLNLQIMTQVEIEAFFEIEWVLLEDPAFHGLIIVRVTLFGPAGNRSTRLALDTGASSTVIAKETLITIGYEPDTLPKTVNFTTGCGVETAARVSIDKLEALDQERLNFSVIAHTLPSSAAIDGLLGLDFFRNHVLTIDFQNGEIVLT